MEELRIHKYIADCGIMSRRAAEQAVKQGRVTINGETAEIGQKVIPSIDNIMLNGIKVTPKTRGKVYIMMYKPVGVVTTLRDDKDRPCITQYIKNIEERVYPLGRLDMYSEGLLVLTNDGEVSNKLMHPSRHSKLISKIYHVKVKGEIEEKTVKKLSEPIEVGGKMTMPAKVSIVERKNNITILRIEICEGKNRQIRRMCEGCGLAILKLKRICIGELNIGTLRPGEWKYMNHNEIKYLKSL